MHSNHRKKMELKWEEENKIEHVIHRPLKWCILIGIQCTCEDVCKCKAGNGM